MMIDIAQNSLVPIGGRVSETGSVTFYMHDGYDKPNRTLPGVDAFESSGTYKLSGHDNPQFTWPIYAVVRKSANG